jgi:hypothetical protein
MRNLGHRLSVVIALILGLCSLEVAVVLPHSPSADAATGRGQRRLRGHKVITARFTELLRSSQPPPISGPDTAGRLCATRSEA